MQSKQTHQSKREVEQGIVLIKLMKDTLEV
jgi:hypothetical protein